MTEAQFDALLERKEQERRHALFCAGTVAAAVMNFSMCRKEGAEPVSPMDFLPQEPKTDDELIAEIVEIFDSLKPSDGKAFLRKIPN